MTFKKTSPDTWEASSKNRIFFIDREDIANKEYIYILTILDGFKELEKPLAFYKLNKAKQYAKQY